MVLKAFNWHSSAAGSVVHVGFLHVLMFPHTSQKHADMWLGHAKLLLGVNVYVYDISIVYLVMSWSCYLAIWRKRNRLNGVQRLPIFIYKSSTQSLLAEWHQMDITHFLQLQASALGFFLVIYSLVRLVFNTCSISKVTQRCTSVTLWEAPSCVKLV